MDIQKHICRFCGKEYETYMKRQRLCSPECKKNMNRKHAREFAHKSYYNNKVKLSREKKIHYKNNKEEILAKAKIWRENNKDKVILQRKNHRDKCRLYLNKLKDNFGGKCSVCGYDKNYACIEFHHLTKGNFRINSMNSRKFRTLDLEKEASNCILLCRNCHTDLHNPHLRKPFPI